MSSRRQVAAYREIKHTQWEEHCRKTYGMVPIKARFDGKCGCGHVSTVTRMGKPVACGFRPGDSIVKHEGKWWNTTCVDQQKRERFQATCRYVLQESTDAGWIDRAWASDPKEADVWRRLVAVADDGSLRLLERVPE